MLTDRELQSLRNMGNECEAAADEIERLRAALAAQPAEPVAWMHPDGRVIPAATMETAKRDGGAMLSSLTGYTIPLSAPSAQPAPATVPPDKRLLEIAGQTIGFDGGLQTVNSIDLIRFGAAVARAMIAAAGDKP